MPISSDIKPDVSRVSGSAEKPLDAAEVEALERRKQELAEADAFLGHHETHMSEQVVHEQAFAPNPLDLKGKALTFPERPAVKDSDINNIPDSELLAADPTSWIKKIIDSKVALRPKEIEKGGASPYEAIEALKFAHGKNEEEDLGA